MKSVHSTLFAAIVTLGCLPASTVAASDQLRQLVRSEMPFYVKDVDVDGLSNSKVAHIYAIMHGSKSHSVKAGLIKSSLGKRLSLRSLFSN